MSLTITSLIVLVLGLFGVGDIVTESEVSQVINAIIQIAGVVGVWWGRYRHGDINPIGMKG